MQIGLRRDNAINYALTGETECTKRNFMLIETCSVINSMYKISVTSRFHKEIDSSRSLIPITGEFLPSLSGWVWGDLNSLGTNIEIQIRNHKTSFVDERTPVEHPSGVPPRKFLVHYRKVSQGSLLGNENLCLGIAWFTRAWITQSDQIPFVK